MNSCFVLFSQLAAGAESSRIDLFYFFTKKYFYFTIIAIKTKRLFFSGGMSGDFLHKLLTFARLPSTRKRCLVVRTMMTAAAVAPVS